MIGKAKFELQNRRVEARAPHSKPLDCSSTFKPPPPSQQTIFSVSSLPARMKNSTKLAFVLAIRCVVIPIALQVALKLTLRTSRSSSFIAYSCCFFVTEIAIGFKAKSVALIGSSLLNSF